MTELFVRPAAAPLLLLTLVVWFGLDWAGRRRARRLTRMIGGREHFLAGDLDRSERRRRRGLFAAAVFCTGLAVMQPRWGEGARVAPRGVDLLVCLDVSRSMRARDAAPDRLERARADILELAAGLRGDRIGLVVFAGEARLVVPLTRDVAAFSRLVEAVGPLDVARGGTDIAAALEVAGRALGPGGGDHGAVVVVTDGEDLEGRGAEAATAFRERGVTVHCLGLGSRGGAKIPVPVEGGEAFLRDREGREVVTALDPETLRRLADSGGGDFVEAASQSLSRLYDRRIRPAARRSHEARERDARKNRFQWPLLLAFTLWILELCLTDRKRD